MARKTPAKKVAPLDMAAIVAATNAGTFVFTSAESHKQALDDGLIEVNPTMTNEAGELATRATEKGIQSMNQTQTPAAPAAKASFAIDSGIALPAVTGRGRGGGEKYPFDALQVGQSFFVPDSGDKSAAKSLASTVSSAQRRYAVPVEGETRVSRKGETVQKMKATREFALRAVTENGVSGARIWRTA